MKGDKTNNEDAPLEQRISDCKELIIQNMEKTLQNKMVYMFLKDRKKEAEVRTYSVNSKDGIIKIQFNEHDKAKNFYLESNFIEKILIRPFNIYFNLQLKEDEMKKYYLEGITEDNQRKLFEAANKVGLCKIYTSYGGGTRGKLKPTGLLSFIRKDPIKEADYAKMTEDLKALGIKIFPYVHDKGMKVSLNLVDFVSQEWFNRDEQEIQNEAEAKAKQIVEKYGGNPNVSHLSVICKKREASKKEGEEKEGKLQTSALFEFDSTEQTYEIYEKVRTGTINEPLGKVRLFFHNEENNSYLSLITQGLEKPANQTEKEFEETLIQSFRGVNKNIVQVNIYPVKYNNSYFGRVYLKNEEEGKNFLVDYASFKSKIYGHYKEKTNMSFNISIDTKTLRKIKHAEKKAKETEEKIKKQTEATKRDVKRTPGAAGQFGGVPNFQAGFGAMNPGAMMPSMMGGAGGKIGRAHV